MSIKVTIQNNIFATESLIKHVPLGTSVQEIINTLNIDAEKEQAFVVIDDHKIEDFTYIPVFHEGVFIRIVPTALAAVVPVLTIGILAAGTVGGVYAAYTGISNIVDAFGSSSGSDDSTDTNAPDTSSTSYLSGGTNTFGTDQPIPLILGKHRYYPMQMASPYLEYVQSSSVKSFTPASSSFNGYGRKLVWPTGEVYNNRPVVEALSTTGYYAGDYVQSLHQLYLLGHKEVQPVEGTFKRDDTDITYYTGTEVLENELTNYGTIARKVQTISNSLTAWSDDGFSVLEVALQSNITSIALNFILPTFFAYDSSSTLLSPKTYARVQILNQDNDDEVVYEKIFYLKGIEGSLNSTVTSVGVHVPLDYTLDEDTSYSVTVTRGDDNRTDKVTELGYFKTVNPDYDGSNSYYLYTDAPNYQGQLYYSDVYSQTNSFYLYSVDCYSSNNVISDYADTNYSYLDVTITDEQLDDDGESELTGDIDDINLEVQTHINVWDGITSGRNGWDTIQATSNPAALYLYVLTGSPNPRTVDDDDIDWESLEEWYTFCEEMNYECNLVLDSPGSISTVLSTICICGRASFFMNGKQYSVLYDDYKDEPTQLLTDKNTYSISTTRTTYASVHGYELSFISAEDDYQNATFEERIYRSGYNADGTDGNKEATLIEELYISGVTDETQLKELARYYLSIAERRNETITVSMDWEYLWANVGDLVRVSYDELLIGVTNGRIKAITRNASNQVTQITLDEETELISGNSYGVTVRYSTGQQITLPVNNTLETTQTFTLTSPTEVDLEVDDLYSFGISGNETGDYIVTARTPSADLKCTLTLTPYAEEIYALTDLPTYTSNLTINGSLDTGNVLTEAYSVTALAQEISSGLSNVSTLLDASSKYAIKTNVPDATYLRDDVLELQLVIGLIYYIKKDDLKLYTADTINADTTPTKVIDRRIKAFAVNEAETYIVYSDYDYDNVLFVYDVEEGTHNQLTTVPANKPVLSGESIYYINYEDDCKVYKTSIGGDNGEVYLDYSAIDISAYNETLCWVSAETGNLIVKDISINDPTVRGTTYTSSSVNNIIATNPSIWYETTNTLVPVYINMDNGQSYEGRTAFFGDVVKHGMNSVGDYAFVDSDGDLYYVSLFSDNLEARLETIITLDEDQFLCNMTQYEYRLTDISVDQIELLAYNDSVSGEGIPDNTTITKVGSDYVVISNAVGQTAEGVVCTVFGTRLQIDANRVVFPGTIEAYIAEFSSLNSTARVENEESENYGEQLWQYDTTTGIEKQYDADGNMIRYFAPDYGLWLASGIFIGGAAPGEGVTVPDEPVFTDTTSTLYSTTGSPNTNPPASETGGFIEGDVCLDTATDNAYVYNGSTYTWVLMSETAASYFNNGGTAGYETSTAKWELTSSGQLICENASIQGTLEVGTATDNGKFTVNSDGSINATDGTFSGAVYASSGSFTGAVYASSGSFTGEVYASSGSFTGEVYASSGSFTGAVYATSGSFSGDLDSAGGTFSGRIHMGAGTEQEIIIDDGTIRMYTASGGAASISSSISGLNLSGDSDRVNIYSSLNVNGTLSKSAGSFKIPHPLPTMTDTHNLVHSFVEAPQADNIYRGQITLIKGKAIINIDKACDLTEGTFTALNTNTQIFTTNESDWDHVKGKIDGNMLTIISKNTKSTALINWLVIGERHDDTIKASPMTDDEGKVITEPLKD